MPIDLFLSDFPTGIPYLEQKPFVRMATAFTDQELLRRFVASGSDDAFRALVERHLGMVLGVATRRTGSRALAEDIAQTVFTRLAQKAARLNSHHRLGGWLYRTTLFECSDALRQNDAHTRKMNAFSRHENDKTHSRSVWQEVLPVLDEAVNSLTAPDREMILLRFFERKSFREIGASLGKSEAAAQKQGQRALDRLATLLRRRGVVITAAVLGARLSAQTAGATTSALVQTVSRNALLGASHLSAKSLILETIKAMTGTKLKIAAAVALLAAVPLSMQWNRNHDLRADVSRLQQELANARAAVPATAKARPAFARAFRHAPRPAPEPSATALAQEPLPDAAADHDDWESALLDADPVRRARRIAQLMAGLTAGQAPLVADTFERLKKSGMHFAEEYRLFLHAWGRLDGPAAVKRMAVATEKGIKSTPELLAAVGGWASANPNAARVWVESLPEGAQREEVVYGLLDGWSMVDFAGAAAYAQSRPRSEARNRFLDLLSQRSLAAGGVPAAQQWFNGIPADEHNQVYKRRAFDLVVQAMLYRDPSAAAAWIAQSEGQPFVSANAVNKTAAKLAEQSPAQAMQWIQTSSGIDPMKLRDGQVEVMEQWTRADANAAGTWLTQQSDNPGYDYMAWRYATTISDAHPQEALAWAGSLSNAKDRDAALREVAGYYLKAQGPAAEQYLLQNGFTPDIVASAKSRTAEFDYLTGDPVPMAEAQFRKLKEEDAKILDGQMWRSAAKEVTSTRLSGFGLAPMLFRNASP